MPKSKGPRKGKSRARKLRGDPPATGHGYELISGTVPRVQTTQDVASAALNHDVVTAIVIHHDDTPKVTEMRKHIRRFQ